MFCPSLFWLLLPCGAVLDKLFYSFVKCLLFFNSRVKKETHVWLSLCLFSMQADSESSGNLWITEEDENSRRVNTFLTFPRQDIFGRLGPPRASPPRQVRSILHTGDRGSWCLETSWNRNQTTLLEQLKSLTSSSCWRDVWRRRTNGVFRSVLEKCSIMLEETVGESFTRVNLPIVWRFFVFHISRRDLCFLLKLGTQAAKDWTWLSWVTTRPFLCVVYLFGAWNPDHESIIYANVKRRNHDDDGKEYVWKS